jgi:hypothetical protein
MAFYLGYSSHSIYSASVREALLTAQVSVVRDVYDRVFTKGAALEYLHFH